MTQTPVPQLDQRSIIRLDRVNGIGDGDPVKKGAGEIKVGRLPGGKRYIATVEPWHGHSSAVYIEPDKDDFLTQLNLVDTPLAFLPTETVRPGREVLDAVMDEHR